MNTSTCPRVLTRDSSDRVIAGVCSGLARYFGVDAVFIRLLFLVFAFAGGASIAVYFVLWVFMPAGTESVASSTAKRAPETIAILLIAIGAVWLLANLGAFAFVDWRIGWPLVLVAAGVALLARRMRP